MEPNQTIKALQTAIQMEMDGKQYYLKMSLQSSNEPGRKLLAALAAEEDLHRRKFEEIFDAIRQKKGWPVTDFKPDGGSGLRTIFIQAAAVKPGGKALVTELDAVKTAMDMENKTFDFYTSQSKIASYPAEKDFYEALATQEREHHLILLDYYQYLKDPSGWFTIKERHSLDGG